MLRSFFSYQVAVGRHDVGIDAGGRHAEVERHQQIELSFRRVVVPGDLLRLFLAGLAEILALHAMGGAEQMLQEIFVPLAGRAEQVRAPHEHVAWPIVRMVRILAGHLQLAGLESLCNIVLRFESGGLRLFRNIEGILLELWRRRQPAHAFGANVIVDKSAVPGASRRGR